MVVKLQVSSLSTNMPHKERITACEQFLNMRDHIVLSKADLCHFTWSILTTNSFSFNDNYYLQIHGTAIGTCMAPLFANWFMGMLQCKFLLAQEVKP